MMNVELIEELVEKARLHSLEYVDADVETQFQRKFAELIVRECIDVVDITHGSKKLVRPHPYQNIVWAIEERFGIDEWL